MDLLRRGAMRSEIETLQGQIANLETRAAAADYTGAVVAMIAESIRDGNAGAMTTAAHETAAGLWARAFASAAVTPDTSAARAVTPEVLAMIGRELITGGECVFDIDVSGGVVRLTAAQSWDISGGANPESWNYELTLPGPTESLIAQRPAGGVIDCRYSPDTAEPWRGIGPLQRALTTGKLAGLLETALMYETGGPVGSIVPTPQGKRESLANDLRTLTGNVAIVDDVGGDWSAGQPNSRNAHWQQIRIGATPPMELVNLRSEVATAILAACGVPAELAESADGTAARESWRRFLHGSVAPVAELIAAELRAKLETPDFALSFDRLFASDLSGRARAFQSLVNGGMPVADAAALAGLMLPE